MKDQLKEKETLVRDLKVKQRELNSKLINQDVNKETLENIYRALHSDFSYYNSVVRERITKKLNKLYGGNIKLKCDGDAFLNLSSRTLNEDEKEFLNLGVNCHVAGKFQSCQKNTELELLYQGVTKLEKENKVSVTPELRPQLLAKGTKRRGKTVFYPRN